MKKFIISLIAKYKSIVNHIQLCWGGIYIGINVHFVNRGRIILHKNVIIRPSSQIYTGKKGIVKFGEGTEIGNHSTLSAHNSIIFGKDVLTGPHIFVSDHNHEYANPNIAVSKQGIRCDKDSRVIIGEGTWIGTNAVIVGNVKIGRHCVIGANSVVTKDLPDYCVAAGIPAKVIKKYNFDLGEWERI
ncbi:MAG: acyltransferase [Floccifex sp.]